MMENRYEMYLPDAMRELQEFQKLGMAESVILEEEAAAKEMLADNQWILTAHRNGLLRLAKMMHFLEAENLDTEELREEILSRWSSRSPYTAFHLQDWLDDCLGEGNYQMKVRYDRYELQLVLELCAKEKKGFLQKHLRRIIPANLSLNVDLNTNTYGKLKVITHGQMKALGWTYGQILLEDLSPYGK
ncbi:MAG: hypothetical protein IKU21_08010 [Anaerotignum sp.]|nr:hypothetical protein [Anaerotignum sp.]